MMTSSYCCTFMERWITKLIWSWWLGIILVVINERYLLFVFTCTGPIDLIPDRYFIWRYKHCCVDLKLGTVNSKLKFKLANNSDWFYYDICSLTFFMSALYLIFSSCIRLLKRKKLSVWCEYRASIAVSRDYTYHTVYRCDVSQSGLACKEFRVWFECIWRVRFEEWEMVAVCKFSANILAEVPFEFVNEPVYSPYIWFYRYLMNNEV